MSILENITKKVTNTAKVAAKRSSELVEVTKLNMNIGTIENKIEKTYTELGKTVFHMFSKGQMVTEELIKAHFESIKAYEDNITEMRQKVLELKNVKACPECRTILDIDMEFCFKCGAKQEIPQPVSEDDARNNSEDTWDETDSEK
jgi:hypothetical protein